MENTGLYLSIYGAILSTIAIVWNIRNQSLARKGIMKIEVFRNTTTPVYTDGSFGESFLTLQVKVVNLSDKTRFIHGIQFELKQRENKSMSMLDMDKPIFYPIELAPGKEFRWSYKIDDITENNLNPIVAKNFRAFLKDTHGKEYKSKWYGIGLMRNL